MTQIVSNTLEPRAVEKKILQLVKPGQHLRFAVPFFTNHELVEKLLDKKCKLDLVVRLFCVATSEEALNRILNSSSNVSIRYFTGGKFHSKLYLFDRSDALFGSANLTGTGVRSNDEICVHLSQNPGGHISKLHKIFETYWENAKILSPEVLEESESIKKKLQISKEKNPDKQIAAEMERRSSGFKSAATGKTANKSVQKFRNKRQKFERNFDELRRIYERGCTRKADKSLPLYLEIDKFLTYLSDYCGAKSEYQKKPVRFGENLENNVLRHLRKWNKFDWAECSETYEKYVVSNHKKLKKIFAENNVDFLKKEEIFDGLNGCYSFNEYHKRWPTTKGEFQNKNKTVEMRASIRHLLYGKGYRIDRMAECIYGKKYKLTGFGENSVQELYGWVNRENVPICNSRVLYSMRFLGFDVM